MASVRRTETRAGRRAGVGRHTAADDAPATAPVEPDKPLSILVVLFIVSLAIPVFFYLGPMRLSPYRLVVFSMFAPLCIMWLTGSAGKILVADMLMLFSCVWKAAAFAHAHGFNEAIEPMGVAVMECFGPYLLARIFVRNPTQFHSVVKWVMGVVVFLLPFAIIETITTVPPLEAMLSKFLPTSGNANIGGRLGLDRVQGSFEHPILYGVFCSSGIALSYFALSQSRGGKRFILPGVALLSTFLSLSTGPFVSAAIQVGLIIWDRLVTRPKRWIILGGIVTFCYVTIDLLSSRTPLQVFITYLTFSSGSAYNRVLIWTFGSISVMEHPLWGIGFNDWRRPSWMGGSMDNFWLVQAVRGGLPVAIGLVGCILLISIGISRQKNLTEQVDRYRKAILITLVGVFVAITSVHLWNAIYCWLMFLIGSGVWIYNDAAKHVVGAAEPQPTRAQTRTASARKTEPEPSPESQTTGPKGPPSKQPARTGPLVGALPGRKPRR